MRLGVHFLSGGQDKWGWVEAYLGRFGLMDNFYGCVKGGGRYILARWEWLVIFYGWIGGG